MGIGNFLIKNKKYLLLIIALLLLMFFQYILFFFEISVYFSLFVLLVFYSYFIFHKVKIKFYYFFLLVFFILIPFSYLISRDFANYFGINFVLTLLFIAIYSLFEGNLNNWEINRKNKTIGLIVILFLFLSVTAVTLITNEGNIKKVIFKLENPKDYYVKIDEVTYGGKSYKNNVVLFVDEPQDMSQVSGIFRIEGWAADMSELPGSKIEDIYFFLNDKPENGGKFLGKQFTWIRREDVQKIHGDKYKDSGFYFEANSRLLDNGLNKIYVYAKSNYFGWNYKILNIIVKN